MGVYELSGAGSIKTGRTLYTSMNANNQYGAMVPIASVTLSSFANFNFTNIPQTYQDLRIVIYSNTQTAGALADNMVMWLNNDFATTKYSTTWLRGDGSSASSSRLTSSAGSVGQVGTRPAFATNLYGVIAVDILNYANTSTFKTFLSRAASDSNGSGRTELFAGLFQSTAGISQIDFGGTGNFPGPGTTATLYGIRAVSS